MGTTAQRPVGWNDALAEWSSALRAANASEKTIRLYRHYLAQLREVQRDPWKAGPRDLLAFIGREGWGASARHSARSAVGSFYRWAFGMEYLDDDPSKRLPSVRVPKGQPRPAPEFVVRQLARDHGERITFMALLMAELGMRCGEVAQVHARDWTRYPLGAVVPGTARGELVVHGKGGKLRNLPVVSERLAARLNQVEEWAFPNGRGSHLSAGRVSELMADALPGDWTAHQLRHRCGTIQYKATRDLLAVSAFLGHANTEITMTYVALPEDALAAAGAASVL